MKKEIKQQTNINRFEDLKFDKHPSFMLQDIARCCFPNGYGLSVVNGDGAYCTKDTYEVAVLHDGELTYDTPLTDDVMSCVTPERITELIGIVKGWNKDQY